MISLRKYLNAEQNPEAVEPQGHVCTLSRYILDYINQFVLAGEAGQPLRSQLKQVRDTLRPELTGAEVSQAAESVASILASHQASSQRAGTNQLIETQHIFAMLNQALVILAEGSDQGASRLATIQESLQRTAAMRDISSMKSSLKETVQFIKTESERARQTAAQDLGRFETGVKSAREFLGGTRLELAGRPEGVSLISDSLTNLVSGEALYVVAYLFDRLNAVTQRYGSGVADELLSHLIKERLKPVMPEDTMYRWTLSSLVAVFSRPRNADKLRKEVANLNRAPIVHKITLNGRTAVLTVSPSHFVGEGVAGSLTTLIEQVDKFTLVAA